MKEKEILKCFFCLNPATGISYYSKDYREGSSIENPTFTCDICHASPRIINQINPVRGGSEGVYRFLFTTIAKWDNKVLGYHLAKKGWVINHLSTPKWRRLAWRIWFIYKPPKVQDKEEGQNTTKNLKI
jgi:hypothetical protein